MNKVIVSVAVLATTAFFSGAALAEVICFIDGTCIDLGDIGNHP